MTSVLSRRSWLHERTREREREDRGRTVGTDFSGVLQELQWVQENPNLSIISSLKFEHHKCIFFQWKLLVMVIEGASFLSKFSFNHIFFPRGAIFEIQSTSRQQVKNIFPIFSHKEGRNGSNAIFTSAKVWTSYVAQFTYTYCMIRGWWWWRIVVPRVDRLDNFWQLAQNKPTKKESMSAQRSRIPCTHKPESTRTLAYTHKGYKNFIFPKVCVLSTSRKRFR